MTNKDWKDVGVRPKLGNEWKMIMDGLWMIAQSEFGKKAINSDNEIHIGRWKIHANFINNSYINVVLMYDDEERIEIRHTNKNLGAILICVFEVVKKTYKTPLK